jgi:hypothetical protein
MIRECSKWAVVLVTLASCFHDEYLCQTDAECDIGSAGRCEVDHHCTQYDDSCPLSRRYVHAGSAGDACFDDAVVPANPCAPDQPPAPAATTDPCAKAVCLKVPSCCNTGWSEACVQEAQRSCALNCDTRIAITGSDILNFGSSNPFTTLDLRISGSTISYKLVADWKSLNSAPSFLDWLAPAHGSTEPRLARLDKLGQNLVIDDGTSVTSLPVATDRFYDSVSSADFDRNGRDEAVLASYSVPSGQQPIQVVDLESDSHPMRPVTVQNPMVLLTWGDWDGDPFPDTTRAAVLGAAMSYWLVDNKDSLDEAHTRGLVFAWFSVTGTASVPAPAVSAFSWADVDNDGKLDLIVWGAELRVHLADDTRPPETPRIRVDCNPLASNPTTNCPTSTNVEIVGTPVAGDSPSLAISLDDGTHNLYSLTFDGRSPTLPATMLWSEKCLPSNCAPIRAVVARDLDGDHALDLVAIDANLAVYIRFANGHTMSVPPPLTVTTTPYEVVRVSVSGAPR